MTNKAQSKNLLSVKEVSKILAVHPQTIYTMCEDKKIPYLKIGESQRSIRFDPDDISEWLEDGKHKVCKTIVKEPVLTFSVREYDKLFLMSVPMVGRKNFKSWNYGYGGIYERKTKGGLIRFDIWYYDQNRQIN